MSDFPPPSFGPPGGDPAPSPWEQVPEVPEEPDAEAAFGRGVTHAMAQRGQILAQHIHGAHHAIDLRPPGVRDDQNFQMRRHAGNRSRLKALGPTRE